MSGLVRINKQNALTAVIKALRDYIIVNCLQPGDRLPTEHELSEKLGISRNIIREGMRYFRTLGIITSSPKVGAVIGRLTPADPFAGYLPFLAHDPQGIRETAQMRMVLETGSAEMMIANHTQEELGTLNTLLGQFAVGRDHREAEVMFHSCLLKMTHNRLIESLIPLTVGFFAEHCGLREASDTDMERISREHREIVDALTSRELPRLIAAFRKHYQSYFQ